MFTYPLQGFEYLFDSLVWIQVPGTVFDKVYDCSVNFGKLRIQNRLRDPQFPDKNDLPKSRFTYVCILLLLSVKIIPSVRQRSLGNSVPLMRNSMTKLC